MFNGGSSWGGGVHRGHVSPRGFKFVFVFLFHSVSVFFLLYFLSFFFFSFFRGGGDPSCVNPFVIILNGLGKCIFFKVRSFSFGTL